MKMNFILPHSFELDLLGVPLLSTLELLLFGHSNIFVRAKAFFMGITSSGSIWIAMGSYTRQTVLFSRDGCSRLALIFVFFIRGIHPVCGEPLFCFSANPDSLSELCGFHIDHRSRSFLLQVSGVSSHLSFCCTSLVSGLIIQEDARFVYWQTAQRKDFVFVQC